MRHTNLFVAVGRAKPKPICTVNEANPNHDLLVDQAKRQALDALLASGVAADRINFEVESVEIVEQETPKPTVRKGRAK